MLNLLLIKPHKHPAGFLSMVILWPCITIQTAGRSEFLTDFKPPGVTLILWLQSHHITPHHLGFGTKTLRVSPIPPDKLPSARTMMKKAEGGAA